MESINYKTSIKKCLSDVVGNFTIDKNGMNLMNRLFQNLNSKLIHKSLDVASGAATVTLLHARSAVNDLFTGNLKFCAFAECDRILSLYSNGLIEYTPVTKWFAQKKKKKTKKAIVDAAKEFTVGVSDLKSLIFPQASLPTRTATIVCELLEELAVKLSYFIQSKVKNSIKKENVRDAIENLLPGQVSKHAIAEGARMVFLYVADRRGRFGRKRKRPSATDSSDFSSAVCDLMSLKFPQASLPAQSSEDVCEMLEEVALDISDFVQTKAQNCIKQDHIREAVVSLLPEQIAHHALAEGARMMMLYEAGCLETVGKKRKITAASTTRKKSVRLDLKTK